MSSQTNGKPGLPPTEHDVAPQDSQASLVLKDGGGRFSLLVQEVDLGLRRQSSLRSAITPGVNASYQ